MTKENCWLGLFQNGLKPDDLNLAAPRRDMAKRKKGRPSTNGAQPGWMLCRAMLIIEGFQKYRMEGCKRDVSQRKAVEHVKLFFPNMPVSVGTVKRVLAHCHSSELEACWIVERISEEVPVWEDVPLGAAIDKFETREVLALSFRPFPKYPNTAKKLPAMDYSRKRKRR